MYTHKHTYGSTAYKSSPQKMVSQKYFKANLELIPLVLVQDYLQKTFERPFFNLLWPKALHIHTPTHTHVVCELIAIE